MFMIPQAHPESLSIKVKLAWISQVYPSASPRGFPASTKRTAFLAIASQCALLMIRFPPIYLHRAINLLHQHQPHKLMRQGHAPEA